MDSLYKEAEKAEKSGAYEEALEFLQKILQQNPDEEHAYYLAANLYAIRGLISQVIQQYLKLSDVLETKGQLDGALEVCNWVISIDPTGTQARLKLIDLLEKKGRKQEAVQQSLNLSRIFSVLGHGEKALELLQKQREQDPDNPDLLFQLGEIHIKQGQIGDGIALYKVVAREMLKQENYPLALDALKRIKAIKPDDLENLSSLGAVYLETGKLDEAKIEFRLILRTDLNHIGALTQLGMIAKMQGSWEEAKLPFRKITELDPNNASGRENYAEINEILGNQVEAIKHYLAAAELYEKEENPAKAGEIYQNILALDPDHTTAQKKLQTLNLPAVPKKRSLEIRTIKSSQRAVPHEVETEKETPEEKSSPLILKTGFKSKLQPEKEKQIPSSKPKSPIPQQLEGGIPRTKPGFKPILTHAKDETSASLSQESLPKLETVPAPSSIPKEIDSPPSTEAPKFIYVEQSPNSESSVESNLEIKESSYAAQEEPAPQETLPSAQEEPAPQKTLPSTQEEPAPQEILSSTQEEPAPQKTLPSTQEEPTPQEILSSTQEEPAPQKTLPSTQEEPLKLTPVLSSTQYEQPASIQEESNLSAIESLQESLRSDIQQLLKQNRMVHAIQLCKDTLKENPENRNLKIALGEIYLQNGFLDEALQLFKEASKDSRDDYVFKKMGEIFLLKEDGDQWAEAVTRAADLQISSGKVTDGIESLLQILAWNPEYHPAHQILIPALKDKDLSLFSLYHFKLMVSSLESSNSITDLIQAYQQMLESNPDAFLIRRKLALCYQELGRFAEAKQEFLILSTHYGASGDRNKEAESLERAIELDNHDVGIINRLRDVYAELGKQEESLKLELSLGDIAKEKEDFQGALTSYKKILEKNENDADALSRVVEIYIKQRNTAEALDAAKRLESIYEKIKDFKNGIDLYKSLIELVPDSIDLHESLARLYIQNNQNREAVQEFMTAGHLSSSQAMFDQAIEAYRHALSLDGTNKDARYQLGVILSDHKNNLEAALSEFKKVRSFDPHHTAALSRLAKGYVSQEKFETALEYIHELIKLDSANKNLIEEFLKDTEIKLQKDPNNQILRFGFGLFSMESGEPDKAIREFQTIIKKSPDLALKGYFYQGICWEEKARLEKDDILYQNALRVYKKGLELKGYKEEEYLELKYALANLYENLGKIQEALPYFQEILTIDMEYKDARDRKKQLEEELKSGKVTRLPSSRRQESLS